MANVYHVGFASYNVEHTPGGLTKISRVNVNPAKPFHSAVVAPGMLAWQIRLGDSVVGRFVSLAKTCDDEIKDVVKRLRDLDDLRMEAGHA